MTLAAQVATKKFSDLPTISERKLPNSSFVASPSPYDIPELVQVIYDEPLEFIKLKFKYHDDREAKRRTRNKNIEIVTGCKSGRVYRVIARNMNDIDSFKRALSVAIQNIGDDDSRNRRFLFRSQLNHALVEEVAPRLLERAKDTSFSE